MTFYNFEKLPYELQVMIFNHADIKLSPYISKNIYKICLDALGNIRLNINEVNKYIQKFSPEYIAIFTIYDDTSKIKYRIVKLWLNQSPTIANQYTFNYRKMREEIEVVDNNVYLSRYSDAVIINKGKDSHNPKSHNDLLNQYFIYKLRTSCQSLSNYAKNKVINKLKNYSKQLDLNHRLGLLSWYMFLRTNLLLFPVRLETNRYFDMDINGNGTNQLDALKIDCQHLYQQLLHQIELMD